MINSLFAMSMLTIESSEVIGLRMLKMFSGGDDVANEMHLMVTEKLRASSEAVNSVLRGEDSLNVINRYREIVAANCQRLRSV